MNSDAEKRVILDTDPGIDDAMALLYLSASPGIRIHSVTTVFGNGNIEATTRNAAYLVKRFGLCLPVYTGASGPMAGERYVPELRVHGHDGFGDTGLSEGFAAETEPKPAWEHIADTICANPGIISLLAIGPLTNLALALRHRPEVADKTREVIVMGGAFGTQGRHGNIRPDAEANFFYDSLAADAVLSAHWPVTIVGLDVSTDCVLPAAQARSLASSAGDAGQFLWQISRGYEEIYRRFDGLDGFCIHDVAAAAYLVAPHLFKTRKGPLAVRTDEVAPGHSRVAPETTRPHQQFCVGVDDDAVVADFVRAIGAFSSPEALKQAQGTSR